MNQMKRNTAHYLLLPFAFAGAPVLLPLGPALHLYALNEPTAVAFSEAAQVAKDGARFLSEFKKAVDESQKAKPVFKAANAELEKFKLDESGLKFADETDPIRALPLVKSYPFNTPETKREITLMAQEVPEGTDLREYYKTRMRVALPPVTGYLKVTRALIMGAKDLPEISQKEIASTVVSRALEFVSEPSVLIDQMVQIILIEKAAKEKVLKTTEAQNKELEDIRNTLKTAIDKQRKKLPDKLMDSVMDWTDVKKAEERIDKLSDADLKSLVKFSTVEFSLIAEYKPRLENVLRDIKKSNAL